MYDIRRIQTFEEMTALAEDWNRLAGGNPLRGFAWHANWWKHYQENNELFVIAVRDGEGTVVGIAPWFLQQRSGKGRVLAWLGSGDVCSDYQTILLDERQADAITEQLAQWLEAATVSEPGWDLLHLDSVPTADQAVGQFVAHLWSGGNTIHREDGPNCWRIALPPTWEEYVETLSKSHRKQVRRIERRQLQSGRAVLHTVNSEQDLERGFGILIDLHQRRRLSLGEPGCFASEPFSGFLHVVAQQLLGTNQLRLSWVEVEGQPAAVEFQMAGGGVTYAYQAGVDPELMHEEPGRIINIATIRQAIEEGQHSFDFLRGDEP